MTSPEISWSVWLKSPQVEWRWNGNDVSIVFAMPPLAVIPLPTHRLIAVATDWQERGAANLHLFGFDGELRNTLTAPTLGDHSHFGSAQEIDGDGTVQAAVEFHKDGRWVEMSGTLDLKSGALRGIHRAY